MDTLLKGLTSQDTVKGYEHASRIFVDGNMMRSPKYAFLFYVVFEYADSVLNTPASRATSIGALCKSVGLPKYTIDHTVGNAYNRKIISQKSIKYEPVSLKFHDDSDDIIREFWYDYMSFYYRDSDYEIPIYGQSSKYNDRAKTNWGYGLRGGLSTKDARPLKAIRIYSFYQKRFSEYTLMNPVITSFRHGEHSSTGSELLEHEMTVTFEAVKYAVGFTTTENFGDSMLLLYDRRPSPLVSGAGRNIFGRNGLISNLDNVIKDLAAGNYAAAFNRVNRVTQIFKGSSISQALKDEGADILSRSAAQRNGQTSTVYAPTVGTSAGTLTGVTLYAAGGILEESSNRNGQQNNVGTQLRVAQSNPAPVEVFNTAQARTVFSDGQSLTPPRAGNRSTIAGFPSLPSATPAAQTTRRTVNAGQDFTSRLVANQNVNLNYATIIPTGAVQGKATAPTQSDIVLLADTNDQVLALSIYVALDELAGETDQNRIVFLQKKLLQYLNAPAASAFLANDVANKTARAALQADFAVPGSGAAAYGGQQAFELAVDNLYNSLQALATPEITQLQEKYTTLLAEFATQLALAVDNGDFTNVRRIILQLTALFKNPLVRSASQDIVDLVALGNWLQSLVATDVQDLIQLASSYNSSDYWII